MPVVLATGFRPFFLLAAVLGAAWIPLWIAVLVGYTPLASHFGPVGWHSHEMIFGYAAAVIAGFLLTAVQNWTGKPTARGATLAALAVLWLAGRVALLFSARLPVGVVAALDCAFFPALGFAIGRPLFSTRNKRNYGFVALIVALTACNVLLHLAASGVLVVCGAAALAVSLDIVLVMIAIVGGRIIPLFTRNALKKEGHAAAAEGVRQRDARDTVALGAMVCVLLADGLPRIPYKAACVIAGVAGLIQLVRLYGWGGRHTLRSPILWVLHLGYAALGVGLLMRGLWVLAPTLITISAATHTLTIGAIGLLTLGMMGRVSLGHTGRALTLPKPVAFALGLLAVSLAARVVWPLFFPTQLVSALWVSAVGWSMAFVTFLVYYGRILVSARADGKPG